MKNLIKLALLSFAVATSCSTEQVVAPAVGEANAIGFGVFTDRPTKGSETDNESIKGDGFGIMGYYTSKGNLWSEESTPNMMYNQYVGFDTNYGSAGAWRYTPVKYWSNVEGDNYSFFAYAPYPTESNGIEVVSEASTAGAPQLSFVVNPDPAKMVDFVAGSTLNMQQSDNAVKFDFKHQLTRVSILTKSNIDGSSIVYLTNAKLIPSAGLHSSAKFTFDGSATAPTCGTWSDAQMADDGFDLTSSLTSQSVKLNGEDVMAVPVLKNLCTFFAADDYLFLLPPNGTTGISDETPVYLQITYTIMTCDPALGSSFIFSEPVTTSVALPAGCLKQGKAYNITLMINLNEIEVSANSIDWTESNGSIVSPDEDKLN